LSIGYLNYLSLTTGWINRPLQMKQLIRRGVDGILTNYPDRLARVIDQIEHEALDRPASRLRA